MIFKDEHAANLYGRLLPVHEMEAGLPEKDRVDMQIVLEFVNAANDQLAAGEDPFFFGSRHLADMRNELMAIPLHHQELAEAS